MNRYKYLLSFFVPILIFFSLWSENIFAYTAIFFLFIIIPILELFTKASITNLTAEEEALAKSSFFYDGLIYLFVPIQFGLLYYFLFKLRMSTELNYVVLGHIIAMGLACGIFGINVAHELGHRSTWYEKLFSKSLLLTSLYMHFFIEHNYGHHQNVSTDKDAASAKRGESLYVFHIRSICTGWVSAWQIEVNLLRRKNMKLVSFHNQMIVFTLIQIAFLALIYFWFGYFALIGFISAALIGIFLLETVNYIEHYGLRRRLKENGDFERTMPVHSWNSNHPIGRILLFELSRHSDHHYISSRKYQILRHFDESPQMPTGYPGMMLLSIIPPLWFYFIHKRIEGYKTKSFGSLLG